MIILILTSLILSLLLMVINMMLSKKMFKDREKLTSFECGFDALSSARLPFSLNFFLIAVIFLIFDVEIILMLPLPLLMFFFKPSTPMNLFILFILILNLGLFYEWFKGALQWFN